LRRLVDSETIVCRVEVQVFAETGYNIELEHFMARFIGKRCRRGYGLRRYAGIARSRLLGTAVKNLSEPVV
jgi:beta-phosphoglucomutase-like phosphatase (HAD superfamily)